MKGIRTILPAVVLILVLCALSPAEAAETGARNAGPQDSAIAAFGAVIAKHPGDAVAHYYRGRAYAARGRFDLALSDFTRAVELNGNFAAAYLSRGLIYARQAKDGVSDRAVADFSQAIRVDPAYALAYANRAWQYSRAKEYDLALLDCVKVISLDRRLTRIYFTKAYAHEQKFQYEEAIATLRALLAVTDDPREAAGARSAIRALGGTI